MQCFDGFPQYSSVFSPPEIMTILVLCVMTICNTKTIIFFFEVLKEIIILYKGYGRLSKIHQSNYIVMQKERNRHSI